MRDVEEMEMEGGRRDYVAFLMDKVDSVMGRTLGRRVGQGIYFFLGGLDS